jgi:putative transposase
MGVGTFQVTQRMTLAGKSMRISRQFDNGTYELEDLETGRHEEWSLIDLLNSWNGGDLTFKSNHECALDKEVVSDLLNAYTDAFRTTYPEKAWEKARTRLEFVFRLQNAPIYKATLEPQIEEIWRDETIWKKVVRPERVPSWTAVAGWMRKYREADRDVRALIDQEYLRGNRTDRYPREVVDIVDDFIDVKYMSELRPTRADVLEDIRGAIDVLNRTRPSSLALPKPSIGFLKSRIKEIDAFEMYASRHGLPAAKLKFRTSGLGVIVDVPLERVEIDHHKMNVFVVDDELLLPLGRPWLTLLLDACTRYIVGYYIGFEEPSSVSVARAIRHALAPKNCTDDVINEWDAWGLFGTMVADNGMELHGETVERGLAQYGIKIQYCPRKKPWFKGKIERLFRTVDTSLTANIAGKTFESILERGDYDSSKQAVVTLSTFKRIVEKWIVDYYHHKPHRGIGKTPSQAWKESISRVDRYLPTSSAHLDSAFSRLINRRLSKDGVEFDSLFYQSEDLRRIREKFGDVIDVDIRVMDDDIGTIMVVVPGSNTLIRVPAVDQAYANGLTRWQHGICKSYKRNKYKIENADLTLYECKKAIQALIARDLVKVKRESRAKQKRFAGESSFGDLQRQVASETSAVHQDVTQDEANTETNTSEVAEEISRSEQIMVPSFPPRVKQV